MVRKGSAKAPRAVPGRWDGGRAEVEAARTDPEWGRELAYRCFLSASRSPASSSCFRALSLCPAPHSSIFFTSVPFSLSHHSFPCPSFVFLSHSPSVFFLSPSLFASALHCPFFTSVPLSFCLPPSLSCSPSLFFISQTVLLTLYPSVLLPISFSVSHFPAPCPSTSLSLCPLSCLFLSP